MNGKNKRRVFNAVRRRHGDNCHWCAAPMSFEERNAPDSATLEHLVPGSAGGTNEQSNLRLAHQRCNNARNKPIEGRERVFAGMRALYP